MKPHPHLAYRPQNHMIQVSIKMIEYIQTRPPEIELHLHNSKVIDVVVKKCKLVCSLTFILNICTYVCVQNSQKQTYSIQMYIFHVQFCVQIVRYKYTEQIRVCENTNNLYQVRTPEWRLTLTVCHIIFLPRLHLLVHFRRSTKFNVNVP